MAKVREVLSNDAKGVDTIISGIGGIPMPQLSLFRPLTLSEPICSHATSSLLEAVGPDTSKETPLIVVISANGVSHTGPRDYPIALTPLYRWLLTGVYDDKREMEALLGKHLPSEAYVVVRPSALTDGAAKGVSSIRQGDSQRPVQGYSISRDDVGLWLYTHVVAAEDRTGLQGQQMCITY
ncbi:hypothetical protein BDY17DRAFT_299844 [Neohortaea acidophila]|uniref:NAD(P)-binding domain-containing protein n=1 Tax=Neohortaea acidophila TaxID=245834 RepID=A0A6A6PPC8_9PEZI|nr:uncharacterized protein BDY17DRAFT_299844 [Neohortaea acidophila]KAF2481862.1 hypothetical protein BDY17DRAFT_299844 [Neohortaea acidophila]